MRLYRIARYEYAIDLSGEGARLYGGRWTPAGYPALYCAEHPALAAWEIVVHHGLVPETAPLDHHLVRIDVEIGAHEITRIPNVPHDPERTGRDWLDTADTLALRVPSLVVAESWNYVINPLHSGIERVEACDLGVFVFDARLR